MATKPKPLDVVQATFMSNKPMTYPELFEGFDTLKAITWSSSLPFIERILDDFTHISIIIGDSDDPRVAPTDLLEIANAQMLVTRFATKHPRLAEAVRTGKLEIRFKKTVMTHEKLYLLESKDNRHRVLLGSGNLSGAAFTGKQGETFICFEDDAAYANRLTHFERVAQDSDIDVIDHAVIVAVDKAGDDVYAQLPAIKKAAEVDLIVPATTEDSEVVVYVNDRAQLRANGIETLSSAELKKLRPSPKRRIVAAKSIRQIIPALRRIGQRRTSHDPNYPKLVADLETTTVALDGTELDLTPTDEAVESDARTFVAYLDGFDNFYGDIDEQKAQYFKLASYMFAAPFTAICRLTAHDTGQSWLSMPYVAVVAGEPSAGKTKMVQFLQKAMLRTVPDCLLDSDSTSSVVVGYMKTAHGVPLLCDDLTKKRVGKGQDLSGIVRAELQLLKEANDTHAIVVITTNVNRQLEPDVAKRAMFFRPPARVGNTTTVRNERRVNELRESMSTALFHRYLALMLPRVTSLLDQMREPPADDWAPDLYELSSRTLAEIIGIDAPWCRAYTFDEFLGNVENERSARDVLVTAYEYNYDMFTVHRRRNVLEFDNPELAKYERERIKDELPPECGAKLSGTKLVFDDLAATEDFLNVRFSRWHKIMSRLQ